MVTYRIANATKDLNDGWSRVQVNVISGNFSSVVDQRGETLAKKGTHTNTAAFRLKLGIEAIVYFQLANGKRAGYAFEPDKANCQINLTLKEGIHYAPKCQ